MKLKQVTGNSQAKAKAAPTISVCYYNGRISFNAPTVQLLGLKVSTCLAFYQDEEKPDEWYFTISKVLGSGQLKEMTNKKTLAFQNSGIARAMLRSMGLDDSANFFISEEKVEGKYWRILTGRAIK